jgi:hypothetical protein
MGLTKNSEQNCHRNVHGERTGEGVARLCWTHLSEARALEHDGLDLAQGGDRTPIVSN